MAVAAAVPNSALSALVPQTAHVFDAADAPVRSSGCLTSREEISRFVGAGAAPDALAAAIAQVAAAVSGSGPPPAASDVAVGLLGCREVFDVVRRYQSCEAHSVATGLPRPALLALYRQEGSLSISPPKTSYSHGPLIATAPMTCRPDTVPFGFDPTMSRVGFNFVYDRTAFDATTLDPTSQSFGLAFRNMITLGGIDSIVNPRVSPEDELRHLLAKAKSAAPPVAAVTTLNSLVRAKLSPFQRAIFDEVCIGLMMCELDSLGGSQLPGPENLLDQLRTTMTDLVTTHAATRRGNDIMLTAKDDGPEARAVLALQTRWFESRTRWTTLLARADRAGSIAFDQLPPFLAYLRFNTGDAIFGGIVLRAIGAMEAAKAKATLTPWPRADVFLTALAGTLLDHPDVLRARQLVRDHWAPHVGTETAWRHIGLVDELRNVGVPPLWLTTAPLPKPRLRKTADVAREMVDLVVGTDVAPAIEQLLYTAPISTVLSLGIMDALPVAARREPLVKAHSFDRLRIVYDKALRDAGVAP
jgi:hypothetical protein